MQSAGCSVTEIADSSLTAAPAPPAQLQLAPLTAANVAAAASSRTSPAGTDNSFPSTRMQSPEPLPHPRGISPSLRGGEHAHDDGFGGSATTSPHAPPSPAAVPAAAPVKALVNTAVADLGDGVELERLRQQVQRLQTQLSESNLKNIQLTRQATIMERELATFRRLRPVMVSIPRFQMHREGYVVFEIKVDKGVVQYSVRHRYSDFRKLHEVAHKECPKAPLPVLPSRGGILGNTGNDVLKLESRRKELETYLRQFVACNELRDSAVFGEFTSPNSADMRGMVDEDALVMMSARDLDTDQVAAALTRRHH